MICLLTGIFVSKFFLFHLYQFLELSIKDMRLKATCSLPGFPKFFCVFLNFLVSKLFLTCLIQLQEKIEGEYSNFFA